MPDTDIATQPGKEPVLNRLPGIFISGIPVQAIIGVRDRHLPHREPFPAVNIRVVFCDKVSEVIAHTDIVVFVITLDAVEQV